MSQSTYIDRPSGPYTYLPDTLTQAARVRAEQVMEDVDGATCDNGDHCAARNGCGEGPAYIGYTLEPDENGHDRPRWTGFAVTDDGRALCEDCDAEENPVPEPLEATYFTFGSDHTLPGGQPGLSNYVKVLVPKGVNAREVFVAWLGSRDFAFDYPEMYWLRKNLKRHYQGGPAYTLTLNVEPAVR